LRVPIISAHVTTTTNNIMKKKALKKRLKALEAQTVFNNGEITRLWAYVQSERGFFDDHYKEQIGKLWKKVSELS